MHDEPHLPGNPDLLLAATFFLMTQYALQRRPAVANAVVEHMERLMECAGDLPPRLMLALPRLRDQWHENFARGGRVPEVLQPARSKIIPFRRTERLR